MVAELLPPNGSARLAREQVPWHMRWLRERGLDAAWCVIEPASAFTPDAPFTLLSHSLEGFAQVEQSYRVHDPDHPLTPRDDKGQPRRYEAPPRSGSVVYAPLGETAFAGHQGFKDATAAFKQSYEKLWSNPINVSLRELQDLWGKTVADSQQTLAPDVSNALSAKLYKMFMETLVPANGREVSDAAVSQIDDQLRHEALLAARRGMGDQAQLLTQARQQLRSLLPESVSTELSRIDSLYAQFIRLRRAAGYKAAAANGGTFTPDQAARRGYCSRQERRQRRDRARRSADAARGQCGQPSAGHDRRQAARTARECRLGAR